MVNFLDRKISDESRETKPQSLIGLSLSSCIREIAAGKVKEEEVVEIISSTKADNEEVWEEVIDRYNNTVWRNYPEAEKICLRLLKQGKIKQPRTIVDVSPNVSRGHWIDADDLDKWLDYQVEIEHLSEEARKAIEGIL